MNSLKGHITAVTTSKDLSIVAVEITADIKLKAIVLESPESAPHLKQGRAIEAIFKETEVIIGRGDLSGISLQNRITGTISQIEKGDLLAKLTIASAAGEIVSIISHNAVRQLDLAPGVEITAMIKLNEMMLREL